MIETLTPLELDGWLEFNAWRTGLRPHRFTTAAGDEAVTTAVFYLDRRGRVALPPNNPYLPVGFRTSSRGPSSRTADWHRTAALLVEDMRERGVANQVHLPPAIDDVRPWASRGFLVGVGYTYTIDFPLEDAQLDRNMRRGVAKATKLGLRPERVTDTDLVFECLAETEARKGFSHRLGKADLQAVARLVGDDHLRMYVCYNAAGRLQSAKVVLHAPGTRAISWLRGTTTDGLGDGAGPFLSRFAFDDLAAAGSVGIDLCGANIPSVAAYKARWGATLAPTYSIRTYTARAAARFAVDWIRSRRGSDDR